jgi:flagellar M-ring protein FliF
MAVVALLIVGFFGFLILRVTTPQLSPLYSGLSFDDSAAIVSELNRQNVAYELRADGETILVPRDQITTLRMALAESGLPARGQVGYEIFDQQSTLGATSFVQSINQVRALEGELARTISSLARVKAARVHLVLPERDLFSRDAKEPTAAIVLEVRGVLSAGEIRAIQHLTASSIDGLSPNRVSIVDTEGQLLASGTSGEDDGTVASAQFEERTLAYENRLRSRLETMLGDIVGAGRARVQVSAELDMNRSTRTAESFDPNGQVVRSTQSRLVEDASTMPNGNSGAGASVSNELPNPSSSAAPSGAASQQSSTTEETVNYEISRSTTTEITEAGAVKRISVAVVVDGSYSNDADGNAIYQARSTEELAELESLVRSAIGFSAARGDQVTVANMQFAARPDLAIPEAGGGLFNFTQDDIFSVAEMLVTLLIAVALIFFVLRPLVKRVLTPEGAAPALPPPSSGPGSQSSVESMTAAGVAQAAQTQQMIENASRPPAQSGAWMAAAKSMGEAKFQTIQQVGALVEEHPKQASMIIRDWLNQAA